MSRSSNVSLTSGENLAFYYDNDLEEYRFTTINEKEPETIQWLQKYLNSNCVFYDIGANVGVFTLAAAIIEASANIYSFEPQKK